MNVDKKLVDCYWYLQNGCTKENCEYRHSSAALADGRVCMQWKAGQCFNKECSMRHPSGANSKGPCIYYMQGNCTKLNCPFSHTNPLNNINLMREHIKAEIMQEIKQEQQKSTAKPPAKSAQPAPAPKVVAKTGGIFSKTVSALEPAPAPQKKKVETVKPKVGESKPVVPPVKKQPAPQPKQNSGPISFGVKSFDQIQAEKTPKPAEDTTTAQTKRKLTEALPEEESKKSKVDSTPSPTTEPETAQEPESQPKPEQPVLEQPADQVNIDDEDLDIDDI